MVNLRKGVLKNTKISKEKKAAWFKRAVSKLQAPPKRKDAAVVEVSATVVKVKS